MKIGDVFVMEEKKLEELLAGQAIHASVTGAKTQVRKLAGEADTEPPVQCIVRVEKVGRPKTLKPAFAVDFGDNED